MGVGARAWTSRRVRETARESVCVMAKRRRRKGRQEKEMEKEKEKGKEKEKEKEKGLQQQECPFLGSIVVVYDQAPVQEGWVAAVGLHEMALQLMPFEEPTRVVCYLRGW